MKCLVCNSDFEKKSDKQVFCSKKCCDLNYRQTKKGITKVESHIIHCLACNKEILVDNNVRKYCNKNCKNDYKNNLRDTTMIKNRQNKICPVCDKEYFPTRNNKEYCSKSCKAKEFRKNHRIELLSRMKRWYEIDGKQWAKDYRKRPYFNDMRRAMYKNNPQLHMTKVLRDRAYKAIMLQQGVKCVHTTELVGAPISFVREYLEKQFKDGMSWNNHGKFGWHIDHIIPCASFDLTNPIQQRKCFHYSNLQPLWWYENLKKRKMIVVEAV